VDGALDPDANASACGSRLAKATEAMGAAGKSGAFVLMRLQHRHVASDSIRAVAVPPRDHTRGPTPLRNGRASWREAGHGCCFCNTPRIMKKRSRRSRRPHGDSRTAVAVASPTIVKPPRLTADERAALDGRSKAEFLEGEEARKWFYGEREFLKA